MSQTNNTNFVLETSGYSVVIPNAVYQATGNLTVSYTVNGAPSSLTITVEGISSPATSASNDYGAQSGSQTVLDTYSSTASTTGRTISVSQLFDNFRITGVWTSTGPTRINVSLTTSGNGPTWTSASLGSVQSYTGH